MVNIVKALLNIDKSEKMDFSKELDKVKVERNHKIPKSEEE